MQALERFFRSTVVAGTMLAGVSGAFGQIAGDTSTAAPSGTTASDLGLVELTDDPTQQELFQEVVRAAAKEDPAGTAESAQYFNLYGPFRFKNDTEFDVTLHVPRKDELFGLDVSHYTPPAFPIEQLATRNVLFLYMKTTQGSGLDGSFASFWARAGRLPKGDEVHRGAYHFLTCGDPNVPAATWGKSQAETFVMVVQANGGLMPTDMPPAVDLEWDRTKTEHDRWTCRKPGEILATVKAFLGEVEARLHRKPIIYTARSWWRERMGPESAFSELSGYPVWLADYSRQSRASEKPPTVNGVQGVLWQFTDSAGMATGFDPKFDANVYKGPKESFLSLLQVVDFR
ncbi:GH25 family lysozyme [Lichenihabitans sp. Uapishka_5]|uniref:GH25 family lysozyme n=1 Tax=Lichenihabitans sp. Uapishka_5 TaxID=3037302 RepID=UPI0029E7D7CB|nr:GH25 family lysozyme [Lichenihabitans sp. Uapishka_5]MDX7951478.1 GH25 family lysozyme [Lichenihabitans sp. Uapishka_5]